MNLLKYFIKHSLLFSFLCLSAQEYDFPQAFKSRVKDKYFDTTIVDEYRYLENVDSEETKNWVKEQTKYSQRILAKMRRRENAMTHIKEFNTYSYSKPNKIGKYYYFVRSEKIYMYKNYNEDNRDLKAIADLSKISSTDKITMSSFLPSKNASYFAIMYCRNGSDWNEIKICKTKWTVFR